MTIALHRRADGVLHTVLTGEVTDEDLVRYYGERLLEEPPGRWREIVDATAPVDLRVSKEGMERLRALLEQSPEHLRDRRVAMVAASDAVFGIFRMWEMRRAALGYEVSVFRCMDEASLWLSAPGHPA